MTPTYNEQYAVVNVYAGKDRRRIDAWRAGAQSAGTSLGKWLAKLADEASGYEADKSGHEADKAGQ